MKQQPEKRYIRQDDMTGYYCCEAVVFLNALIYHNLPGCTQCRGVPWQELVNLTDCRNSPYDVKTEDLLNHLGLTRYMIPFTLESIEENLPVMIPIDNGYDYNHYALVIGVDGDKVTMANYEGTQGTEAVNERTWDRIRKAETDICHSVQPTSY
jgi:hypothetical protein